MSKQQKPLGPFNCTMCNRYQVVYKCGENDLLCKSCLKNVDDMPNGRTEENITAVRKVTPLVQLPDSSENYDY